MSLKFRNQLNSFFPANHAFFIAVQDYENVAPLRTPVNDVKSLAEVLGMDIHDFQVHEALLNPGKQALENFIANTLPVVVGPDDRVLLYFAGHGIAIDEIDQDEPKGFLLPVDAQKEKEGSYVSMSFLNEHLQRLPCRHLLLLLDCCFAGSFQWAAKPFRGFGRHLPKNIYRQRFDFFVKHPAWQVITSAAYHQQALDVVYGHALGQRERGKTSKGANSPFAEALLYALRDGAGDRSPADGLMTVSEIFAYLQDRLAQISHIHTQKPAFFPLVPNHRQGEFIFLNPKVKLHLSDYRDDFNPYRGLQAYEYEDRAIFYGRERVVSELLAKLKNSPFVVVIGDSGAGKSSVVKAGLLPELEKQGFHHIIIRPGAHPMETLNEALREANVLKKPDHVILVIDQLEELKTQYPPVEERDDFLSAMADLLKSKVVFQKIIVTVRSEFESVFELSALKPWWYDSRYPIPGFSHEELQEIIWQPMKERCIEYEDRLVEELIREVENRIGGLPLLSFALSELYEGFKTHLVQGNAHREITWEDYRATGGVIGALQKSADQAYSNLSDDAQKSSLRRLILRLVSLSDGETAGRRVPQDDLVFDDPAENDRIKLLREQWTQKRLLRSGSDSQKRPYIEPAHDALIRSWSRVQDWIQDENRGENILVLAKLGVAVEEYHRQNKQQGYLWKDDPGLEQVEKIQREANWLPNRTERAFLEQSRRLKRRKRNIINTVITAAFIALASLTVWALLNRNEAIKASHNLTAKAIESAVNSALALKNEGKYDKAIIVITDSKRILDSPPPYLDSLVNIWDTLQNLTASANTLLKQDKIRLTIEKYEEAGNIDPQDNRIQDLLKRTKTDRDARFEDRKTKGINFMNFGSINYAIERFEEALQLKDDPEVRHLLEQCKSRIE